MRFFSFAQITYYYLLCAPIKLILRPQVIVINSDLPKRNYIIAANHISRTDPFLLGFLPWNIIKRLMPLSFLTTRKYYDNIFIRTFIYPLGAYASSKNSWTIDDHLKTSYTRLKKGASVLIFPEGKLITEKQRQKARPGVLYLHNKTKIPILPLYIQGCRGMTAFNFLRYRKKISLVLGQKISPSINEDASPRIIQAQATHLMGQIYQLEKVLSTPTHS